MWLLGFYSYNDTRDFTDVFIIRCVALYQASVSGLCDGTRQSVGLSDGLSVRKVLWQNG